MTPDALKKSRTALGYTQARMADLIGISRGHFNSLENGSKKIERTVEMAVRCLESHPEYDPEFKFSDSKSFRSPFPSAPKTVQDYKSLLSNFPPRSEVMIGYSQRSGEQEVFKVKIWDDESDNPKIILLTCPSD